MSSDGLDNLNYTVHVPYNETISTGGDSLHNNLNIHYEVCDRTFPGAGHDM